MTTLDGPKRELEIPKIFDNLSIQINRCSDITTRFIDKLSYVASPSNPATIENVKHPEYQTDFGQCLESERRKLLVINNELELLYDRLEI